MYTKLKTTTVKNVQRSNNWLQLYVIHLTLYYVIQYNISPLYSIQSSILYISCVKYISIKFRKLAIFFFIIRCINYNGIVTFILVKF